MFDHPRRDEIDRFHATRLGCEVGPECTDAAHVFTRESETTEIVVFESPGFSVIQAPRSVLQTVSHELREVESGDGVSVSSRLRVAEPSILQARTRDLTLYLDPERFCPADMDGVRAVAPEDAPLLLELRAAADANHRWYVETDHVGLFARFRDGAIVSAASHLLEDGFPITDLGVLSHPAHRRMGYGKAATSASIQWGLERDLICQWVTTDANQGSLALARSLGFDLYGTETVFRCLED